MTRRWMGAVVAAVALVGATSGASAANKPSTHVRVVVCPRMPVSRKATPTSTCGASRVVSGYLVTNNPTMTVLALLGGRGLPLLEVRTTSGLVYVRVTSSTIVEVAALRATVGQLLSGRERVLVRAIAPVEPSSVIERVLGLEGPVVARAVFLRVEAPGSAKPRPQSGSRRGG